MIRVKINEGDSDNTLWKQIFCSGTLDEEADSGETVLPLTTQLVKSGLVKSAVFQ